MEKSEGSLIEPKTERKCYSCDDIKLGRAYDIEYWAGDRSGKNNKYLGDCPFLCDDCAKWKFKNG